MKAAIFAASVVGIFALYVLFRARQASKNLADTAVDLAHKHVATVKDAGARVVSDARKAATDAVQKADSEAREGGDDGDTVASDLNDLKRR